MPAEKTRPDYTKEIAALEEAIKRRGSNPEEVAFVLGTLIEEMHRVNGEALSLESQITVLTKRRAALDEKLTVVRGLAAKFGITPPLATSVEVV